MAYQNMRQAQPGIPPPTGLFPTPPHPTYGPPPMMMVPSVHPGILPPPPMGVPPPGMPPPILMAHPGMPPPVMSEPIVKVPVPSSTANMKVATTVFVGNISEKASDTLIRQILLRCGPIEGWKRVQDATGKLQGFGFCEYADPESTLRALRLLHNLKLGDKALVAKVDAKTRKDLLKYLITRRHSRSGIPVNEDAVKREVDKLEEDKDAATNALITEVPEEGKSEDSRIQESISTLLKDYLAVLSSSKSNEDIQRERDVKESILFMAKQSGKLDPNSTLEDMDMEDDMKTLVSDEIKRFRESYKRSDEARVKDKKPRDKLSEEKFSKVVSSLKDSDSASASPLTKGKRERSRSPPTKRESSPPVRRPKSPPRSRSQERQEREKRREAMKLREREEAMKEEEEYEERMRQRRTKERERAFKQRLMNWEGREWRKSKEIEKETKKEKERKEDVERERKHLGEFLAEYDDSKDDQKYYKGNAYARRRREREVEVDLDERDRMREKDELEELRLQVIERQAREILSGHGDRDGSAGESPSPKDREEEEEEEEEREEEEEDMDVPMKEELEEDIPLTKSGYTPVPPAYPPIQVHSAPSVNAPDKFHPVTSEGGRGDGSEQSPGTYNSPTIQTKLAFGLKKSTPSTANQNQSTLASQSKSSKLEKVFSAEDDEEVNAKPKKKLVPIEYSDEEGEEPSSRRSPDRKRLRHSSGRERRGSGGHRGSGDYGLVANNSSGGVLNLEEVKDRKLTSEERKKLIQTLVNNIPTVKEEVFQYPLRWDQIDKALIEKRVGPWINKKIMEYIGEEEPVLTEFICNKLSCHISPDDILNDIAMVLDDEAEVFIVKLWRLLIYETEAKHLGIAKSY